LHQQIQFGVAIGPELLVGEKIDLFEGLAVGERVNGAAGHVAGAERE
jgi:hypothetical protein